MTNFIKENQDLRAEVERLKFDLSEECRLNGMGSEREARLMAQVEEGRRENAKLREALEYVWDRIASDSKVTWAIADMRLMVSQALSQPAPASPLMEALRAAKDAMEKAEEAIDNTQPGKARRILRSAIAPIDSALGAK